MRTQYHLRYRRHLPNRLHRRHLVGQVVRVDLVVQNHFRNHHHHLHRVDRAVLVVLFRHHFRHHLQFQVDLEVLVVQRLVGLAVLVEIVHFDQAGLAVLVEVVEVVNFDLTGQIEIVHFDQVDLAVAADKIGMKASMHCIRSPCFASLRYPVDSTAG